MQNKRTLEIILGVGLGPLRFGLLIGEVEEILGPPTECSDEDEGEYSYKSLDYVAEGINLTFDKDQGFRLSTIEVDSWATCILFGEPLFPRTREQVLDLLHRNLPPEEFLSIEEDESEGLEQASTRVPSLRATFYFDLSGSLEQLQWGPFWSADDEIIWPG